MSIQVANASRYIWNQSTALSFTAPNIPLSVILMPCFNLLLGADNTTAGTLHYEEGVSASNFNGPVMDALAWSSIFTIPIVAGLFPNGQKGYVWPSNALTLGQSPYFTAAQGCRLRFERTGGGSADQLNVAYYGKSLG
jgi:hypothetical protein